LKIILRFRITFSFSHPKRFKNFSSFFFISEASFLVLWSYPNRCNTPWATKRWSSFWKLT